MNPVTDIPNPLDLKRPSLIALVWRLISTIKRLWDEVATLRAEIPAAPKPEVKAYRIHTRSCCRCKRKVRGCHPDVAPDQFGATAHRIGPRAQAAAHTLYYGDGIPQRKVLQVLKSLTGLSVTQGAIEKELSELC